MKICFIGKYPPIQGGVSQNTYWLARLLAERGHDVHVITNAFEVEDSYRAYLSADDLEMLTSDFQHLRGGRVRLWASNPFCSNIHYIPFAKPWVSKLAGMATQEISEHNLDMVFSYYFEPYGVAAALAASIMNVPHVMRHAGSDMHRLTREQSLAALYRHALQRAAGIITAPVNIPLMRKWGVHEDRCFAPLGLVLPPSHYHPDVPPLEVNAFFERLWRYDRPFVESVLQWEGREFDPHIPTIGLYGKVGSAKGSFDLVLALARLHREGVPFNFLAMVGGQDLDQFRNCVLESGIQQSTWLLPFLPNWKVPSFIRACTAVCFLERDFWLQRHTPMVAREVLACGTCLIVSGEIASKQAHADRFEDGVHWLVVRDPREAEALAERLSLVLTNPSWAEEIGRNGYELSQSMNNTELVVSNCEQIFQQILETASASTVNFAV